MIDDPLALTLVIVASTAAALWLADRFAWAARIGPTLLAIAFGAFAANLDLVPAASPVYAVVAGPVTWLAIAWLLLAVDLRDLRIAGPRLLAAFALALVATATGALTAAAVFRAAFPEDGWRLAGVMTGTYSGGGLNFVAVGRAVELPESLFAAAAASDNVITALWIVATLLLPVWLGRHYPPAPAVAVAAQDRHRKLDLFRGELSVKPAEIGVLGALGLGLVVTADEAHRWMPGVPAVVWLTTLALAAAQLPPVRRLRGSLQLGTFALHLFFAYLGIACRFAEIVRVGWAVFWFTALTVVVHGVLLFGLGRLARLDVETLAVASQAAVGGPTTAMAQAVARRLPGLTLPAAVVGLTGYAVGNYAGLAIARLVRALS